MNKASLFRWSLKTFLALSVGMGLSGCANKMVNKEPSEPRITEAELLAYCPQITLSDGTTYYNSYLRGGEGDSSKIIYQAAINAVTRVCGYPDGKLTMKVAAAGRVVPGPQFKPGTVILPIRVVAKVGDNVVYSMLHPYPVLIKNQNEATQFIFSDDQISMPKPQFKNVQILVGFETVNKQIKAHAKSAHNLPLVNE